MSPRDSQDRIGDARALRALAAGLIADPHEAEDLLQETWLRGLRSQVGGDLAWFKSVLRNLVRDRARERGRREWTERAAARPEALPSEAEMLERLDLAQRLAEEVARLPEPYRASIHLRYFEGLAPLEIARRSGVPAQTVHTRLRRALDLLRERMDSDPRQRGKWMLALAPLALPREPALAALPKLLATLAGVCMVPKIAACCAAAVVALALLWSWHERDSLEVARPIASVTQQEAPAALPVEERAVAPAGEAFREPVAAESEKAPAPAAARTFSGTVIVTDEAGEEHASEDGTLTIATGTSEANATRQEVEVVDGRWTARANPEEWLAVLQLVAGGRGVLLPKPQMHVESPIEVRGRWVASGYLRVIDARTKVDLDGVEVRCAKGWRANPSWTHPGDDERIRTVVANASSPVELPERHSLTPYWVHAPGYAWSRVDFVHRVGGQRTVELVRAGRLTVAIDGPVPEGAWVRIYPDLPIRRDAGWQSWMAVLSVLAKRDGPTIVDDFAPPSDLVESENKRAEGYPKDWVFPQANGSFVAAVETGRDEETLRLGSAPVRLIEGEDAFVTVPIDASLLDLPRTHLSGTLRVPADLGRAALLRIERVGDGQKPFSAHLIELSYRQADRDTLLWDAGLVRTGDYEVSVLEVQYRALVHAPGPGRTRIDLAIPALVRVTVEVVDAETGLPIEPTRLQWSAGRLEGRSTSWNSEIQIDPKSGRRAFQAVEGRVSVHAEADGYEGADEELDLRDREVACTVQMRRATGLKLHFRLLDAVPALEPEFFQRVQVESLSAGGPELGAASWGGGTWAQEFQQAGSYRIVFPALRGFEPIEPLQVEIPARTTVERIVTLVRSRL